MNKEWLKELQERRRVMWICRLNQQKKRRVKKRWSTEVEEATTIRQTKEISKRRTGRTIEEPRTKATKEVVLQVEEEVVVEIQTRATFSVIIVTSMDTIRQNVLKRRIRKMMQGWRSMMKKKV